MKFPVILIHGLYGWGKEDQNKHPDLLPYWGNGLIEHLQDKGYEVYYPSLGPYNGAWDRACILWAYLFGGRVDFGKIHSAMRGHERYGETYPGVLKDLGKTKGHAKIELFGHSFGGATVKEISNLFTQGDELERNSGDHSPLFDGGHGDLLHTVTTLSGVNNGTTAAVLTNRTGISLATIFAVMMTQKINDEIPFTFDTYLEQWEGLPFSDFIKYSRNGYDNIAKEMDIDFIQKRINPRQVINPNTYYFAQRAYSAPKDMTAVCGYCGRLMRAGMATGFKYSHNLSGWYKNDGFVNLIGQSAPLNQKHMDGEWSRTTFQPGIWYNMPSKNEDHLYWCGHSGNASDLYADFDQMLKVYQALE